jgi:hypothetical protein
MILVITDNSGIKTQFHFMYMFLFALMLSCSVKAQSWDFIKEKDGIKIYTRVETGRSLKSYKAVTDINVQAEKIYALMDDINNTDWWDKKLTQIDVLLHEKGKRTRYYMIYDLPWPVTDRDLCVEVTITTDPVTNERKVNAVALNGVIPESKDMVRIKDYLQMWTITPVGKELTHIVLEGFVDPAGSVPKWISNLLIIESPIKAITGLRDAVSIK